MKIIVAELKSTELVQNMKPSKNTIVEAIRPHIYRHNFATGSLKLQITDLSDTLIAESNDVSISSIGTANYFHGYVRFNINAYLAKNTEYKIKLVGDGGYSFDESAYCGWCNGFDLAKYPANYTPSNSLHAPLDLEIWARSEK